MILLRQLARRYALVVAICASLMGGLVYHEFVTEPQQRKLHGIPDMQETLWAEDTEVYFYWMIPLVLACGWWLLRQTLAPLNSLALAIEQTRPQNLRTPLPRTAQQGVNQLAAAFDIVKGQLHDWSQQMRQFTLHASHELKTPLTVMAIQFETMLREEKDLSPEQVEWLECQRDEVLRLGKIVDDLTMLTKADAGLMKLECRPVRFNELVRESYEDAQILAEANQIRVTLSRCAEVSLVGDRNRLRQLLLNLVDNAIKYNQPGGLVTIALRCVDGSAELEITNTGEGIPPAMQEKIFQRFVRGDEARSRAIDGSGLGLSICRWIVEAHKGTIRLCSQPDEQTTVLVRLPLAGSTAPTIPMPATDVDIQPGPNSIAA